MRGYKTTLLKIILFITTWFSSIQAQENVQWYAIDQVEQLAKKQQKKVLIEIYTNWSEGFRQMESNALNQKLIVRYLNENFLTVKLDAETRSDITFRNKTYHFVSQSGVGFNELAAEMLQGQMTYPTFVFLDENMNLIQTIQYRSPEQFEMIITYFGNNYHKKMPWIKYEKSYTPMKR